MISGFLPFMGLRERDSGNHVFRLEPMKNELSEQ